MPGGEPVEEVCGPGLDLWGVVVQRRHVVGVLQHPDGQLARRAAQQAQRGVVHHVVDGRAEHQRRRGQSVQMRHHVLPQLPHRVRRGQRGPVVRVLAPPGVLDVAGDPGDRGDQPGQHRQEHVAPVEGGDRRIDQRDRRDLRVTFGQPDGQRPAHGHAPDEHQVVRGGQPDVLLFLAVVPVGPGGPVHLAPGRAVAGQPRHRHVVAAGGQVVGQGPQRGRGAGEAVAQQDGAGDLGSDSPGGRGRDSAGSRRQDGAGSRGRPGGRVPGGGRVIGEGAAGRRQAIALRLRVHRDDRPYGAVDHGPTVAGSSGPRRSPIEVRRRGAIG
ncbi:hypothetical protein SDC9_131595 [bioreactor metagenome]|uniref:Uncharacterized protein n=1 Tax=bioreactor metagenome TaxID=1076179 RepID=A0A645D7B9_9ZZZZ